VRARVHQQLGTDFVLDGGTERRRQILVPKPHWPKADHRLRRALVHGWEDTLVMNWDEDYRGGVLIYGHVSMPGGATIAGQNVTSVLTTLTAQLATMSTHVASLTTTLSDLRTRVAELDARVSALEAGR